MKAFKKEIAKNIKIGKSNLKLVEIVTLHRNFFNFSDFQFFVIPMK